MKDQYVEVHCQTCGAMMGYVVSTGHTDWLCAQCSPKGKPEAVNLDPPSVEPTP